MSDCHTENWILVWNQAQSLRSLVWLLFLLATAQPPHVQQYLNVGCEGMVVRVHACACKVHAQLYVTRMVWVRVMRRMCACTYCETDSQTFPECFCAVTEWKEVLEYCSHILAEKLEYCALLQKHQLEVVLVCPSTSQTFECDRSCHQDTTSEQEQHKVCCLCHVVENREMKWEQTKTKRKENEVLWCLRCFWVISLRRAFVRCSTFFFFNPFCKGMREPAFDVAFTVI